MLRIYVANDCPGSPTALRCAAYLHVQAPEILIEVVNLSNPGVQAPSFVFGTPMYVWNDHILFLGNPSEQELVARVRSLYERTKT
ncbi:hypothetical protein [Roseiflexus sp.]|uniref:hypothetical protein n=1 Tax=Roseiflexus sp. TaxID=2562120 RepID=UPI0021DDF779|nr:hypothetical protein [Roseiflexus sp.]GIW02048.1 MAG: hypothetical protein KatS3mg058_3451 [Roseiflexus sp.]